MPCERYEDALMEAAATGAAPPGELRAHLAECAACREAFVQEQSLFAAIDSGLHTVANAEVPPSLFPRVRVGLDDVAVASPRWTMGWFPLAGAAVAAAALFFAVTLRQNRPGLMPADSAANRLPAPQITARRQTPSTVEPSEKASPELRPRVSAARNSASPEELVSQKSVPEIVVPRDQESLLVSYAQQWSARKRAPLVAGDANPAVALLEVPPIQIDELDVKPLAEGNSQ
jgi:hypothetical protein